MLGLAGCAVSHKRGSDAQVTVDYYLQNRGSLPEELSKIVAKAPIHESLVTVQWTVNERGETENVTIQQDTLHNDVVNTLILEHLKTMKFPKTPKFTKTTVEYTYKFMVNKKR
jgi:hypothetical protein